MGKTNINQPLGNGNHTTYKHGDDCGMVNMALFYPVISVFKNHENYSYLRIINVSLNQPLLCPLKNNQYPMIMPINHH